MCIILISLAVLFRVFSAPRREWLARGVSPWKRDLRKTKAPTGRHYPRAAAPLGLPLNSTNSSANVYQGLTPLANNCRLFEADPYLIPRIAEERSAAFNLGMWKKTASTWIAMAT